MGFSKALLPDVSFVSASSFAFCLILYARTEVFEYIHFVHAYSYGKSNEYTRYLPIESSFFQHHDKTARLTIYNCTIS